MINKEKAKKLWQDTEKHINSDEQCYGKVLLEAHWSNRFKYDMMLIAVEIKEYVEEFKKLLDQRTRLGG